MENFATGATRSINGRSSSSNNINTHVAISIHTRDTLEAVVTDVVMTKPRRMEKVPLTIREDEKTKRHFDPRVVSVGPYHHGQENLQMAERIKPIVAQSFVSSSGRDMAEFRQKILEIVDDARRYYLESSTDKYSNEKFAEMMLLDGIFVAAIMESMTSTNMGRTIQDELKEHLGAHAVYLMLTDIFLLLENQLPYQGLLRRNPFTTLNTFGCRQMDLVHPIKLPKLIVATKSNLGLTTWELFTPFVLSVSSKLGESMLGVAAPFLRGLLGSNRSSSLECLKFLKLFWILSLLSIFQTKWLTR